MRSFTFDVVQRESSNGYTRITEGASWFKLAKQMQRKGRANLVLNSKVFAGYGASYEVGYTRYKFTVTETV